MMPHFKCTVSIDKVIYILRTKPPQPEAATPGKIPRQSFDL